MLLEPGLLKTGPQGKYQELACTGIQELAISRLLEIPGHFFLQRTKDPFPTVDLCEMVTSESNCIGFEAVQGTHSKVPFLNSRKTWKEKELMALIFSSRVPGYKKCVGEKWLHSFS